MSTYNVSYNHTVVRQVIALVEADSEEEAREKLHNGDVIDEEDMGEDGIDIEITKVQLI